MHTQRADQYSTQPHLYRSFCANMQGKVPHGARWKQHRQKNKKKRLKNAIRTNRGWNNNSNNENQRNAENAVWAFSLIKNILRDLNIQPSLTANSLIDPPEEEESQFNRESLISVLWKSRVKHSVVLLSRQVLSLTDLVKEYFPGGEGTQIPNGGTLTQHWTCSVDF